MKPSPHHSKSQVQGSTFPFLLHRSLGRCQRRISAWNLRDSPTQNITKPYGLGLLGFVGFYSNAYRVLYGLGLRLQGLQVLGLGSDNLGSADTWTVANAS